MSLSKRQRWGLLVTVAAVLVWTRPAAGGVRDDEQHELDRGDEPPEPMTRAERTLAWWQWSDSSNHYEEYADDDRVGVNRLLPSTELMVAVGIVAVFVGGFAGFIALLALTR